MWGKFRHLRYLLFMVNKLIEEISRQKELMNLHEQGGLAKDLVGGLAGSLSKEIQKSVLSAVFGDLDVDSKDSDTDTDTSSYGSASTDFEKEVNRVIDNFEGGYYHPDMNKSDMGKSGETMMGMDRKHGKGFAETSAGREFWKLIDDADARKNWKWNYMGGSLESRLRKLVAQMIQPEFEKLSNRYLNEEARKIVKKNPNLTFHFIYATWNGSGWFQKFANKINQAVDNGITNPKELEKIAIKSRKESGNSIIAKTGEKMSKVLGIKNV